MLAGFVDSDTFAIERRLMSRGMTPVAGTDEAGRGPLAGPVVAACVILPPCCDYLSYKDSKKLTARSRARLFAELDASDAVIGVGICSADEIDRINILQASLLAMKKAVIAIGAPPAHLLVDGKFPVPVDIPQTPLIKGESRSASIAAASIIAKETRDRIMADIHRRYPQYGFSGHKGYPTAAHRRVLAAIGPCPEHRRSFKGVNADAVPGKVTASGIFGP